MLTDQQMSDARRWAGYQLPGTAQPTDADQDLVYLEVGFVTMSLYSRLTTLSAVEEATLVSVYLANLAVLEAAIYAAGANLDTESASVWKHNPDEVADRTKLFKQCRRDMCSFLGIDPGPGLGSGVLTVSRA
jgi:hypothetical protein